MKLVMVEGLGRIFIAVGREDNTEEELLDSIDAFILSDYGSDVLNWYKEDGKPFRIERDYALEVSLESDAERRMNSETKYKVAYEVFEEDGLVITYPDDEEQTFYLFVWNKDLQDFVSKLK